MPDNYSAMYVGKNIDSPSNKFLLNKFNQQAVQLPSSCSSPLARDKPKDFRWMPENLFEALRILGDSEYMKTALGSELVNAFIKLKKHEWSDYSKHLTSWERKWYLNC